MNIVSQILTGALLFSSTLVPHNAQAGSPPPLDVVYETIATGFSSAVAVRHAGDGTNRLFVVEQSGQIRIIKDGSVLPTPFLDIGNLVSTGNEQGLLGLAFHPNYSINGLFYVYYTNTSGDSIVTRYSVSGNPDVADQNTALKIISVDQDFSNHNGGDIHFGPADGFLYLGLGDGGSGDDPCNRGQTIDPDDIANSSPSSCAVDSSFINQGGNPDSRALLGAMLRIDVDNPGNNVSDACGEGVNYGIPADNPFSDGNNDCGEIWAWGLRNPYRWSFDRTTGDLFSGDVGQGAREEVNYQPGTSTGGENYGWVCREGFIATPGAGTTNHDCPIATAVTDPIIDYVSTGRCSVIGGYVYRGPESRWQGIYLYGDFCSGEIFWSEETAPGVWTDIVVLDDTFTNITGFGEDEAGNMYYTSFSSVVKISDDLIFESNFD
jgi:glucose/arabinose dehydrogenase